MKRIFLIFPWILVLFLGGVLLFRFTAPQFPAPSAPQLQPTPAFGIHDTREARGILVTRIIDGDTIEVDPSTGSGLVRVRYIGIDAPEVGDCLGEEASNKNKELVLNKKVQLEKDISETDRFRRLLRYVYVDELFINEELVRAGFAKVVTFPPDVKYVERFLALEREARSAKRGLWNPDACPVQAAQLPSSPVTQQPNCTIKGNISVSGEKIYHLPGCGSYEKTVISEEKGEEWFCSEEEAVLAGWRKAKNCP